jgi:hypothetical protein
MTPELYEAIVWVLQAAALFMTGGFAGTLSAERKNRRLNAAKVECVECPHETAPKPLGAAMAAAAGHQEATGHRCMVVKAA